MKSLLILCVLSFVGWTIAGSDYYPRGCIYALGRCVKECEEGTYSYTTGCGPLTPEPSCDVPHPSTDRRDYICDYSACYCSPPTVRDRISKKCVRLEDCPKLYGE